MSAADTPSQAGREAFDRVLMEVLQGVASGMSARDIVEETDASLPQIRSAVARLVAKEEGPLRGQDGNGPGTEFRCRLIFRRGWPADGPGVAWGWAAVVTTHSANTP